MDSLLKCVLILFATIYLVYCKNDRVKEFFDIQLATCNTSNTGQYLIEFPGGHNYTLIENVVYFYGNFTVKETIREPLQLAIVAYQCSMDMKTCKLFNTIPLSRICTYINDDNGIWVNFFRSIKPKIQCPIKPGRYTFVNSKFDLTFFTNLPIERYRWHANLKLNSKDNGAKRELYCLAADCSVRWIRKS